MKAKWLLGSILSVAALTATATAQISVYIGTPPPPMRYEVPPPMPMAGYVWTPGYWSPYGGRYVWAPGRWMRPPYYGAAWMSGGWNQGPRGWSYHNGYWGARPHPGYGPGYGYGPGRFGYGPGRGHAYGHYKHGGR